VPVPERDLGDGLVLRALDAEDAEELFALVDRNRTYLARWMPWPADYRAPADAQRSIRDARTRLEAGTGFQLAVVERGRIVGMAALAAIDSDAGTCRCGYWLAPACQGRGVMTRAVASLLEHAFDELGLRRVELRATPDNLSSRRVAERLGFRFERTPPAAEPSADGTRDQVQYVLDADAWHASRRATQSS